MALTKVSGGILDPGINVAGIVTATGFDGPFTGGTSRNITAGIITATGFDLNGNGDISGNLVIGGNLTANGDFTTLNTTLREVEILRVDADTTATAGIITQRGSGDILNLFDNNTEVFSVTDGGDVGIARSIFHLEDTNTLIGFPENDNIAFRTGGDERLRIGSTGTIDVSTTTNTSPTYIKINSNRSSADDTIGGLTGVWNGNPIAGINFKAGADTTNKDEGDIMMMTYDSGTSYERLRITSAGQVGIGSAIPGVLLDVQGHSGSGAQHTIRSKSTAANASNFVRSESSDGLYIGLLKYGTSHADYGALEAGGGAVYANSSVPITIMSDGGSGYINFATGGNTERLRIDSNGVICVNHTNALHSGKLQVSTSGSDAIDINAYSSTAANGGRLTFYRSKDATIGSNTIVADNDSLGRIDFRGYNTNGNAYDIGATIEAEVDGTVNSSTDMPSALVFKTSEDGSASPSERLRIKSDGNVGIGHTNPGQKLDVSGAVQASQGFRTAGHPVVTYASFTDISGGNYATRLGSTGTSTLRHTQIYGGGSHLATFDGVNGRLGIGTAVPATQLHLKSTDPTLRLQRTGQNAYGDITADTAGKIIFKSDPGGSASSDGFSFTVDNSEKLNVDSDGITVTGEVAASQDYPNFRPTLDFNFAAEKKLDPRITYERTGPASFVNEFGKVVLVGDNAPRFDYDPITREGKGLLIEESRTNRNTCTTFRRSNSGRFGMNSAAEQLSGLNTNGVVSPMGTAKGVARAFFTGSESAPDSGVYAMASTSSSNGANYANTNTHTSSVWIRTGLETVFKIDAHNNYASASAGGSPTTITFIFTLTGDGTVTSIESGGIAASVTKYPNNWYRCTITYHRNSTSSVDSGYGVIVYPYTHATYNTNSVTGDIFWLWGPQVEEGAFPTSYIQNANDGTMATRGDDIVRIMDDDFTDIFGTEFENFSVVADFDNSNSADAINAAILEWWGESTGYTDRIQIFKDNSSPFHIETRAFGGNTAIFSNGNLSASSKAASNRFATSWSVDYSTSSAASRRWAFSFSGEEVDVVNDNTGTTTPTLTRFGIGCSPTRLDFTRGTLLFKRLMVYNQTLSDNQLRTLTS